MRRLYLTTGFLGAGKTTFLKHFIRLFAGQKIMLIVNEFGKTGVDGALLAGLSAQLCEIAGGFGSFLRLESAAAIGLIPPALAPRCRVLGNAALAGAAMLLHDAALHASSAAMADSAETVELSTDPFFMDQYVQQMMF